jgi:hypothetical protein
MCVVSVSTDFNCLSFADITSNIPTSATFMMLKVQAKESGHVSQYATKKRESLFLHDCNILLFTLRWLHYFLQNSSHISVPYITWSKCGSQLWHCTSDSWDLKDMKMEDQQWHDVHSCQWKQVKTVLKLLGKGTHNHTSLTKRASRTFICGNIYLFVRTFIYLCFFNDTVSSSDKTASNGRMVNE